MIRHLDSVTDEGCWITHDRVYAFVSAGHGITEVGYHGLQPVSKNSRILVRGSGVLTFHAIVGEEKIELQTSDVDWQPTLITSCTRHRTDSVSLEIRAAGRQLVARCTCPVKTPALVSMVLSKDALFTDVHGERTWKPPQVLGSRLVTSFRDLIMLQSWLNRTGPYAGDFLIPELIRRQLFQQPKRSGLASRDDLRAEFREADFPIYDAEVFLKIGGDGCSITETNESWVFARTIPTGGAIEFVLECADSAELPEGGITDSAGVGADSLGLDASRPALTLPGFPNLEEFVSTVPGIVDSCVVQDLGIPRACPGRYYWIWAWDALVSMMEALRWGDVRACTTVRFVDEHRDVDGRIPARWTHSLQPLDTPSPGGIEFLQLALAYESYLETRDMEFLRSALPGAIVQFESCADQLLREGLVTGEGFYPDLPAGFGRSGGRAVCMEVGSWYVFSRILENIARLSRDVSLEKRARNTAESISRTFNYKFWDSNTGFFVDSIDPASSGRSRYHPLFATLFLQSSLGLALVRSHIDAAASFVARELVTDEGMRMLPLEELDSGKEIVLDSWYPHWDLYALKILRRAGDARSITRWLTRVEECLRNLGYCPEHLALRPFREQDPKAWTRHGSASNLNCVTSWMRGLRESVAGFEFDPGGVTHLPLSLPIPRVRMKDIRWQGSSWTFESIYDGPYLENLSLDESPVVGSMKIPVARSGGDHLVSARYGNKPAQLYFAEIVNARLLEVRGGQDSAQATIEPMGTVDIAIFSVDPPRILANGRSIPLQWDRKTKKGFTSLSAESPCTLLLETE